MKLLDKFNDYTMSFNEGFKLAFGNILVSVACHNQLDALCEMKDSENGIVGKSINLVKTASDLMAFTFGGDNTEVAIIDLETDEYITSKFTNLADDYYNIAYGVTPKQLVDILLEVTNYINNK